MRGSPCLYRRPSGIYAVRIVVPMRLRGLVGRGEIHSSTGQKDLGAAKIVALAIQLHWRNHFVTLNIELLTVASPLLQGGGTIGIQEAAGAIGMTTADLMGAMLNDGSPVLTYVQNLLGWQIADIHDIDMEDGRYLLNDVEAKGINTSHTGFVRFHDSAATLSGLIANNNYNESVFRGSGTSALFLGYQLEIPLSRCVSLKSAIERIRARLAGYVPTQELAVGSRSAMPAALPLTALHDPITAKHGHKRFSELFAIYKGDRDWNAEHTKRMDTETGYFVDLMDDPALDTIEKETILEYAKRFARLPNDVYQAKRKFKVDSLHALTELAEAHKLELKSDKSVKRHVSRVSEVLAYGVEAGMLRFNAAANYKRGRSKTNAVRPQDERDIFSPDELQLIFSQDVFLAGAGRIANGGKTNWRPYYYWLPLLGLTTGGRLRELSQLYLVDLCESPEGGWYLDFNLSQGDKLDDGLPEIDLDKSLKTVNSIRVVPIPELVIRLGLPAYIDALRSAGYSRLFPELKWDKTKGYGKPAGKWFNENFLGKKLGIVRDGKKTFHSLRHNYLNALDRLGLPERVLAQVAGHERGHKLTTTRYVKDQLASELEPQLAPLHFQCLEKIAPFDAESGIAAVMWALRLKKAIARAGTQKVP